MVGGWYRFKQVRYVCANNLGEANANNVDKKKIALITKLNNYSLYMSVTGNLSLASIAAFRSTEHLILHGMMAGTTFNTNLANMVIQTWISFKLIPTVNSLLMARFRLALTILFVSFLAGAGLSLLVIGVQVLAAQVPIFRMLGPDRLKWDESYPGYWAHGISAIFENLAILIGCPYYASFLGEANRSKISKGKLTFRFRNSDCQVI